MFLFIFSMLMISTQAERENVTLEKIYSRGYLRFDPKKDNVTLFGISSKLWEGPYIEEAFIGSIVTMPCARKAERIRLLETQRTEFAKEKRYWSLLWVHHSWDNVVDPWMGDGRRNYDWLQVTPYWLPDLNKRIDQSQLNIHDTQPTDRGVYACVLSTYPPEKGISPIVLENSQILSIHVLRIRSGQGRDRKCKPGDEINEPTCRSGFERWAFNIYYPTGKEKGDVLFQTPCHADVFLTAVTHAGVDATFWSLGWRFMPYGTEDDVATVEVDPHLEMRLHPPVHVCPANSPVPCDTSSRIGGRVRPVSKRWDLAVARERAGQLWRARWLVLLGSQVNLTTGTWQCWLQGLGITKNPNQLSVPIRWHIDEVLVRVIPKHVVVTWLSAISVWRTAGLLLAPFMCLLVIMIISAGRVTARLYRDRIPTKHKVSLNVSEAFKIDGSDKKQAFATLDPYSYLQYYLNRSGIESYHQLPVESMQRLSRRLSQAFVKK